ncbi:MAG: PAS domain-containing protein [Bryobacteraceae bacterium]|jgi:PAS domain S-box-containing protein
MNQALQPNRNQIDFRALFDATPSLYLVLLPDDPKFTIVAANAAYAQATLTKPEEIVGRPAFEVFPDNPDDPHATGMRNVRASLREVLATRATHAMPAQKYDIRRPADQGGGFEERYWSPVNSPLLDANGNVQFIVHRVEDVTELVRLKRLEVERGKVTDELRARADRIEAELFLTERQLAESQRLMRDRQEMEAKLVASEARFSLAFAQAPIGMVLLTPAGVITEVNQAYLDTLGYTPEELTKHDSSFYTHPDDIPLTRNFFASLQAGPHNTGSIEKRYFRKDGELLWARASATMRRDDLGRPAQVIAIVEDITAHKRAEARYRFLAESIPQMVWTATPDGMLDYVNGRGTQYFHVPQEALLGTGWLEWVHPDERDKAAARWKQSLEKGTPYETSFRLKRSDGSWRWHLVRALPLAGENGNIVQWFGTCTDIEDQKQSDAKLYRQWQTFDTALSHTPDFTYTFDLDGRFTYINRSLLSLWQKSFDEAVGKNFFELDYPLELAARLQRQIQQVIETKQPLRDQTPFTGPSGETRYYDYIFVPVLDEDGRVRVVAGSTRDITEQNRAAQQIEDDRRRWRELLVQTPAGIAVLRGPEHTFEWVNPVYGQLVGRTAEALIGKSVFAAFPEIEGQIYVDLLNNVYRTGQPFKGHEAPVHLNRGGGVLEDLYINFVYLPTRNVSGEIDGIFVHVVDVTDTVIARKQVEESERQFRTLAETIPHLAWMADETGHIFWYNRRWYDYTGTTLEEIEGWGWQLLHDPNVLPEVLKHWRRALSSGEAFEMVFPLRRADGQFRPFLTRVEPVKDAEGRVVRWFGTNTDITDQRRTEEELRRMNRELEEFAYVASHDLQEPLRMVNIYTQQILRSLAAEDEKLIQYSNFVRQGVNRMEALIQDLLAFSRNVHTDELQIGAADLSESLTEALSILKDRIEDARAIVTTGSLPNVRGDTAQMAHVFQNILSNALKYRRNGVIPEITISAERGGGEWIVRVRDNGIGFEPRYAERIFGLFKRLHKEEYPGTGLGLAICKRIVERYGGRIWAEGRPGDGATFYFSLPFPESQ